jgi:MFS family permease
MRTYHILHRIFHRNNPSIKTLTLLYLAFVIRAAIFSFLNIFLPIYYFMYFSNLGYSITQSWTFTILLYVFIYSFHTLGVFLGNEILKKYSIKKGLILSLLPLFFFSLVLSFQNSLTANICASTLLGLHNGLWWKFYHLDFSLEGNKREYGKAIGYREALGVLSGAITPLFAGYVIKTYGYNALYLSTTLLITTLSFTLIILNEGKKGQVISIKDIYKTIKKHNKDFIAYIGVGTELAVADMLWPILLIITLKEPLAVGVLTALIAIAAFVAKIVSGKISDKFEKEKIERFGAVTVGISWLGKLLTQSTVGFIFFDIIHKSLSSFFYIPMVALSYFRGIIENRAAYLAGRELSYITGKLLVCLFSVAWLYTGLSYWYLLIFGIIGPILTLFFKEKTQIIRD